MTEQNQLKTNHNIRIVNLTTGQNVLCIFGELRNDENAVVGYRMYYPHTLSLGEVNEDGTIPVNYTRWCPFSPIEEHRLSGEHIISVVYPDNGILNNFVEKLKSTGIEEDQLFSEETTNEEETNGDNGEPAEAGE